MIFCTWADDNDEIVFNHAGQRQGHINVLRHNFVASNRSAKNMFSSIADIIYPTKGGDTSKYLIRA